MRHAHRTAVGSLTAVVLALAFIGCRSRVQPPSDTVDAGPGNRPWYAGTPEMQKQIHDLLAQVPDTVGAGRIELGRRIVSYGEPATPILVKALTHPNPDMRSTAAWLLGFEQDPRTIEPLVRATADPTELVRYEAAATLIRMTDPRGLPVLLDGLDAKDPRVRAQSLIILKEYTGKDFGYKIDDPPNERAAAVARWRAWASSVGGGMR